MKENGNKNNTLLESEIVEFSKTRPDERCLGEFGIVRTRGTEENM